MVLPRRRGRSPAAPGGGRWPRSAPSLSARRPGRAAAAASRQPEVDRERVAGPAVGQSPPPPEALLSGQDPGRGVLVAAGDGEHRRPVGPAQLIGRPAGSSTGVSRMDRVIASSTTAAATSWRCRPGGWRRRAADAGSRPTDASTARSPDAPRAPRSPDPRSPPATPASPPARR